MSEDTYEYNIYPSYITEIQELIGRVLFESCGFFVDFEEMKRYFHILEYLEEEEYHAEYRQREKYKQYHKEQTQFDKFKKFLTQEKGYTTDKVDELFNGFGIWLIDEED